MNRITSGTILIFMMHLICGCNSQKVEEVIFVPDRIRQVENLNVYSSYAQSPDTVKLIEETVFESNEDIFMDGYIYDATVDGYGRVFIGAGSEMGVKGIYVFNSDGSYETRFSRHGRGPGEFETIRSIHVSNDKIYVLGLGLQKVGVFSLDDFSHIRDVIIRRDDIIQSDSMGNRLRADQLFVTEDGSMIMRNQFLAIYSENDIPKVLYYRLSEDGMILPGRILEVERFPFYFPRIEGTDVPFPMPFTRSSLVAITKDGSFYTAWTDDFLIKKYDRHGNYLRAFYYPVGNSNLSLNELSISRERQRVLDQYEMPETWPVLHTMEVDDEGRLWVAVITDSKSVFQWWVLNPEGELLARFTMPGKRSSRTVMSTPLIIIKNEYFYTRETDEETGLQQIVRYRIEFEET